MSERPEEELVRPNKVNGNKIYIKSEDKNFKVKLP